MEELLKSYTEFLDGNEELAKKTLEVFEKEFIQKKKEELEQNSKEDPFKKVIKSYQR